MYRNQCVQSWEWENGKAADQINRNLHTHISSWASQTIVAHANFLVQYERPEIHKNEYLIYVWVFPRYNLHLNLVTVADKRSIAFSLPLCCRLFLA